MSKERTLANIAQIAYWDTQSENKNTFDRVAKAVEKEVLERFKNDEEEPIIAGQELNHYQVLRWIEKYGSTSMLQYMSPNGLWDGCTGILYNVIDTQRRYRVSPKKVNDPDDPTTWERGVSIFYRDCEYDSWTLGIFISYSNCRIYKYCSKRGSHKYAKLATPEQIEAWKLINDDKVNAL